MGGRRPTPPTTYMPTPQAPVINQTVQTQEGWDAARDFINELKDERSKIVAQREAAGLGMKALGQKQQDYQKRADEVYKMSMPTKDPDFWSQEQKERFAHQQADRKSDEKLMAAAEAAKKALQARPVAAAYKDPGVQHKA